MLRLRPRRSRRAYFECVFECVRRRAAAGCRVGVPVHELPLAVLPAVDLCRPEKDRPCRPAVDRHRASFVTDCVGQVAVDIGGNELKVEWRAVGNRDATDRWASITLSHPAGADAAAPSRVTGSLFDHTSAKSVGSPLCIASAART